MNNQQGEGHPLEKMPEQISTSSYHPFAKVMLQPLLPFSYEDEENQTRIDSLKRVKNEVEEKYNCKGQLLKAKYYNFSTLYSAEYVDDIKNTFIFHQPYTGETFGMIKIERNKEFELSGTENMRVKDYFIIVSPVPRDNYKEFKLLIKEWDVGENEMYEPAEMFFRVNKPLTIKNEGSSAVKLYFKICKLA